jgi:hypothetical protein
MKRQGIIKHRDYNTGTAQTTDFIMGLIPLPLSERFEKMTKTGQSYMQKQKSRCTNTRGRQSTWVGNPKGCSTFGHKSWLILRSFTCYVEAVVVGSNPTPPIRLGDSSVVEREKQSFLTFSRKGGGVG